ncbi:hypothetical protein ECG_04581 [Echinococcus granulosus]|nr:hypothetical protein ECG_04581 [Echinococcus granulosus]
MVKASDYSVVGGSFHQVTTECMTFLDSEGDCCAKPSRIVLQMLRNIYEGWNCAIFIQHRVPSTRDILALHHKSTIRLPPDQTMVEIAWCHDERVLQRSSCICNLQFTASCTFQGAETTHHTVASRPSIEPDDSLVDCEAVVRLRTGARQTLSQFFAST